MWNTGYLTIILTTLAILIDNLLAWRPEPGKPVKYPLAIAGVTIHVGNGTVIDTGIIGFYRGKITFVKPLGEIKPEDTAGYKVEYYYGYHVYPGIIALNTIVGLTEIDLVRATHDFRERGMFTPSIRSWIAFNTDSRIIPTLRLNGILIVEIRPEGGIIAGQSAAMNLDAWNWEDALIKGPAGIHLYFPRTTIFRGWWGEPATPATSSKYMQQVQHLDRFLKDAYNYLYATDRNTKQQAPSIPYEAMRMIFEGKIPLFVHANTPREITDALHLLYDKWQIKNLILVTGARIIEVAEEVKQRNIPVVYVNPHSLPYRDDVDIELPFKVPAILDSMGILVAIGARGSWNVRNLPYQAGTCVGYGLSWEKALQMITLNPAKLLGIDSLYGSLEPGKSATLLLAKGNILNMRTAHIVRAFIDGREINLTSHQVELYKRYARKFGISN